MACSHLDGSDRQTQVNSELQGNDNPSFAMSIFAKNRSLLVNSSITGASKPVTVPFNDNIGMDQRMVVANSAF